MNPELAKLLLLQMSASGLDTPAARIVARELQKVALTAGAKGSVIEPGMMPALFQQGKPTTVASRMKDSLRYLITGVSPETWFSPAQPLQPAADRPEQGTAGRRFDFSVGTNLNYTPRSEGIAGGVPFWVLRNLADAYDLLRLVIETRKDQIASFSWEIAPKDEKKSADDYKDQVKKVTAFFEKPTPEHDWMEWLRVLVEDDLVCGSMALYPRLNRGGQLHSLVPIDVTTVKKLVDDHGYQPMAPSPAFQGILKGIPAVDYMACEALPSLSDPLDSLIYWIRNPRTWKLYGYSPVEQVLVTVNIALRRQQFQMEYYTDGSIPDMIIGLPESVTPDQIKEFQQWWDSVMTNTAIRRKVRFVPEMKGQITPKEAQTILVDTMDEWLARIICFCFSIAPTALIKMTNRAQSEQVAETAKEEGLMPFLHWLAWKLTWVANNLLQCPDVKFAWKLSQEIDPKVASDIRVAETKAGIISINEAREQTGHPPVPGGEKNIIILATGVQPLKEAVDRATKDLIDPPAPPPALAPVKGSPQDGGPGSEPGGPPKAAEKFELHVHQSPVTVHPAAVNVAGAKIDVHPATVNMPAIKVETPAVKTGDTHVHVSPAAAPDVFVNVEGGKTEFHADIGGAEPMEKTITATKDKDGKMTATVTNRKAA